MEPCYYLTKLFVGFLAFAWSVVMLTHFFLNVALKSDGKTIRPFLSDMLEKAEQSVVGFFGTVLLVIIGAYLVVASIRGNVKFGLRFFFVNFYPIVPRETFVNSFMANCLLFNLYMPSLVQFIVRMFRGYMRGTEAAKIFEVQVKHMYFFNWFYDRNFFVIWLIVWWFIALIYFILKPYEKIYLGTQVKRADLGSKQ